MSLYKSEILMNINKSLVLLLKAYAEDSDSLYSEVISSMGYECVSVPPVHFQWTALSRLQHSLREPDKYSAMVLTSQRSVQAIKQCIDKNKDEMLRILKPWKCKPIFVVGPATHRAAAEDLGLEGTGQHCGNSEQLADTIVQYFQGISEDNRKLLFPCSSLKRETLPAKLLSHNLFLDCIECYQTGPHPDLECSLTHLFNSKGIPFHIVFFSPSGVQFTLPILNNINVPVKDLKLVSMGPATRSCIQSQGLACEVQASSPDPKGLASALQAAKAAPEYPDVT